MANLTTVVRDENGNELFRMTGRQPRSEILREAIDHAGLQADALRRGIKTWTVTTQRGSTPAKSFEELHDG